MINFSRYKKERQFNLFLFGDSKINLSLSILLHELRKNYEIQFHENYYRISRFNKTQQYIEFYSIPIDHFINYFNPMDEYEKKILEIAKNKEIKTIYNIQTIETATSIFLASEISDKINKFFNEIRSKKYNKDQINNKIKIKTNCPICNNKNTLTIQFSSKSNILLCPICLNTLNIYII